MGYGTEAIKHVLSSKPVAETKKFIPENYLPENLDKGNESHRDQLNK